jgi:cell division protein FtsI/penicillin-binding protein 2
MTTRLTILQVVVAGSFILLAVGFWIFQVPEGKKFAEMAENNHMRRLPLPAPRGVLFDRDGKVPRREPEHLQHRARPRARTKELRRDTAHPRLCDEE